jgi:hypothetical protein
MVGFRTGNKEGVFAYLSDTYADTTITTAGDFTPILGNFTNNPFEAFGIESVYIVYLGSESKYFEMDWNAAFSCPSDSSVTIHIGISINSETLVDTSGSVMGTFVKTSGEVFPLSGTKVVLLNYGDTIQLQCTADGDGDVIRFHHFTTSIAPFFRGI